MGCVKPISAISPLSERGALLPLFDEQRTDTLVVAGPCSAESAAGVLQCAEELATAGVRYFRAGVWKPRTRPGSFEGMGARALPWLRRVKVRTGLKVLCEVGNAAHTAMAVRAGIDGIWLGARTVANPFAVQEIADELHRLHAENISVLVKNPVNPDLDLWIGALERLFKAGIRRLGAVHRGFSSYMPGQWRNPPQWSIPIELHRRLPLLPLLHDPSHCSGKAAEVPALARQALRLCFQGLMIECHPHPELALSDASQQITPAALAELLASLPHDCAEEKSRSDTSLESLRHSVDALDDELLQILARRMEICRSIGDYKLQHDMPVVQPNRYALLLEEKIRQGEELGMEADFLRRLFADIHTASVEMQLALRRGKDLKDE